MRELAAWGGERFPVEMRSLAVGDVGILGTPGEPFAAYGRAFREAADVGTLLPVSLADGFVGYLPTLDELENRGYEIVTSKVVPGALVRFREAGLDLVIPSDVTM